MASPNQIVAPGEGRMPTSPAPKAKPKRKPLTAKQAFQPIPLTPKPQPDPVLAKNGIFDPPDVVAQRVRAIKQAHDAHFGTPATAGHVYDVLRSNVPTEDIPKLYDSIPRTKAAARVRAIPSPDTQDRLAGQAPEDAIDPDTLKINEAKQAIADGTYWEWRSANEKWLKTADAKTVQKLALGVAEADRKKKLTVQKGSFGPDAHNWNPIVELAAKQILTGVTLGPIYFGIAEGKAVKQTVTGENPKALYETNKELAKQAVKGVKEDFLHPKENPGYLLLDIFGLTSALAGGVTRAGAVGRAVARQEGKGAIARAALSKPAAGTRQVKVGDLNVDLLNSENPLVRQGQKMVTNRANKKRATSVDWKQVTKNLHAEIVGNSDYIQMAQSAMIKSTEQAKEQLSRAQKNLRSIKEQQASGVKTSGGMPIDWVEQIFRLDVAEAQKYLSGDVKGSRELRAVQIAMNDDAIIEELGGAAARDLGGYVPADIYEPTPGSGALAGPTKFWQRFVSQEARAKGKLASDRRVENAIRDMTRQDLEKATGWANRYALTRSMLPQAIRNKVSRGEDMALMIESLDEPGDFAARAAVLKDFHQRQIQLGLGDPAAHAQRIRDIEFAEKAMKNPSPKFQKALDLTRQAVSEMEALKEQYGLTDAVAQRRVAQAANVLRGDPLTSDSALSEIWQLKQNLREGKGDAGVISSRISELQGKLSDLPVDMRKASKELDALIKARSRETDPVKIAELDAKIEMRTNDLQRSSGILGDVEQLRDASFYFPLQPETKMRKGPKNLFRGTRNSAAGVPWRDPSTTIPGLKYQFKGNSLQLGNYRVDTTRLVGEQLGKTVRGVALLDEYKNLLKASTETRRSQWDVPIRTPGNKLIPDKLREIMNEDHGGNITALEAEGLSKVEWDKTVKELYGATYNERKSRWEIDTKAEDGEFRWVDSRLLGADASLAPAPSFLQNVGRTINTPFRFATLYARPAYLANLVGSAGMALWTQGGLTAPNFVRALAYKPAVKDTLRELVGAGRTSSFIPGEGMATKAERKAAHAWNVVTDRDLRVTAAIHFLRKAGVRGEQATDDILKAYKAGDEAAKKVVDEAMLRAKKSMVEFDNLSWFEKEYLRQFIFIYPWMKGSAMWNLRAIQERPLMSAVVAQWGDEADDYLEEKGGDQLQKWMKKTGFFPIFWNGDNPVSVNANGVNTLSSLSQMFSHAGDPDAYRQFGGPLTDVLVGTFTGRDQYGNQYKNTGLLGNAYSALLENTLALPQVTAFQRAKKYGEQSPLPGIDIADRETLMKRRNAALKQVALSPGWSVNIAGLFDIPGQLLVGGAFNPREVNKMAVLGRQWKLLPESEKQKIHKDLVLTALGMQADALKRPVDPDVKKAVERYFDMQTFVDGARKDAGGDLTPLGETKASLDWLVQNGLATQAEADKDLKYLKANTPNLSKLGPETVQKYLDPQGKLRKWDEDISTLAKASDPATLDVYVRRLRQDGGGQFDSPKGLKVDDLRDYGRQVADYSRQASDLQDQASNTELPQADRSAAERALKELEDKYDNGIVVNGKRLPSPVRVDWASRDDASRAEALSADAKQSWSSLTSFEKELLGRKPSANMNTAWGLYQKYVDDYGNTHASTPQYVKDYYANYVAKNYDGFKADYLFSKEKLATRLSYLKPIQNSPYRAKWDEILNLAKQRIAQVKNGYPSGQMNAYWKSTVVPWLIQNIQSDPGFDAEVKRYGYDMLNGLLEG